MAIFTLIFGVIGGFIAGMIVAAGSWRNALTKLGVYALNAAKVPVAASPTPPPALTPAPSPTPTPKPTPMPMATRVEDPQKKP